MELAGKHIEMSSSLFTVHFTIIIILILSCLGLATTDSTGNETDRQALLQLKHKITSDPLGVMQTWNNTIHFCHWHGVICGGNRHRERITKLELPWLKLAGSISPYIGNLSFLRVLNLDKNSFTNKIPQEIGQLKRLQILYIPNNTISGEIPSSLSSCSKLTSIELYGNLLSGEIPGEIGLLSNLKTLSLGKNQLTGSIPPSLGNLSSLEHLSLAFNTLNGVIPQVLGQLTNLEFFSLFNAGISGSVPASIFNLTNIQLIDFGFNQIEGSLPSHLGLTMPYIEVLSVANNRLTGSFPTSISNASNLVELQVQDNNLRGDLPSFAMLDKLSRFTIGGNHFGTARANDFNFFCSLTKASHLEYLEMPYNNFGGKLPECISNLSSHLLFLNVQDNQIWGTIPNGVGNLVNLEGLGASFNQLSGSIPFSIGRLRKLKLLYVYNNSLSGDIPSSLGNMSMLIELDLGHNNLQGHIPPSLGECNSLAYIYLSENNLSGSIPPKVIGLSSLSIAVDLSYNLLTGELPSEVGNLKNLGELDVSNNRLSGMLPNTLGSCVRLEKLFLHRNSFQGSIPSSLRSLRGLTAFDISRNNISGKIPEFIVSFGSLRYLNLSFNDFEGAIPIEGVFKNASATFLQGNSKLCGGILELHFPKCNMKTSIKRSNISQKLKIAIAFVILGVTLVFSFLIILWFRKKKGMPSETSADNSLLNVSYQTLLKATDGFSVANLVGSGSFGSVYKGILEESGVAIAVKVINLQSHGASRSFVAECETLRNVRHRNLVNVLTICSGIDFHGNDFKAIVYEFMDNGSLEYWLHPPVCMKETGGVAKGLNFYQRLNAAIDIGYALEYLHHHCETPIIHCDLKPSNVLLDNEMVSHVGDFGLAKFVASDMQENTSSLSSSLAFRGTIGYAPPEYGMRSVVTTYGDVYSYGILLMEMFTGKRPTDDMFKENLNLRNFVKTALPNGVAEIIDPTLLRESFKGDATTNPICNESKANDSRLLKCLNSIFEIGIRCSVDLPIERLNMIDVVSKLCSIRDKALSAPPPRSAGSNIIGGHSSDEDHMPHFSNVSREEKHKRLIM